MRDYKEVVTRLATFEMYDYFNGGYGYAYPTSLISWMLGVKTETLENDVRETSRQLIQQAKKGQK